MFRLLVLAFAAFEIAFPERIVAWGERLAFETPGASPLRRWTIPMARVEGVAFAWLVLSGRVRTPRARRLLVPLGVPALLAPERYLGAALAIAYEDPDAIEPKRWVVPLTRLLGLAYVLAGLWPRSRES